ncbi:expressed unknown protein [Seminavis robusta]|uniref:Uncharacterized protein n=1 Tax=Seminavis robusta TaxID=568900 RepID=A0A9N8F0J2_9STRA|nr:expressed unknown protein [Seminavis robusta]|eukprot:Sro2962_g341020.1 n/a (151) ;mRNA; r:5032-5484
MKESSSEVDQGKKLDTEVVGARLCDDACTEQMAKATDSTQDDEEHHALMQVALEINEADKLSKNAPSDTNAAAPMVVSQGIPSTNNHASVVHVPVQEDSTPQNQQDDIQPTMLRRTTPYTKTTGISTGSLLGSAGNRKLGTHHYFGLCPS